MRLRLTVPSSLTWVFEVRKGCFERRNLTHFCDTLGDASKLLMALAACLLGYGEVGLWIKKEASKPKTRVVLEGNPYIHWITEYGGEGYQQAVKLGIGWFCPWLFMASPHHVFTSQMPSRKWPDWTRRHQEDSKNGVKYGRGVRSLRKGSGIWRLLWLETEISGQLRGRLYRDIVQ